MADQDGRWANRIKGQGVAAPSDLLAKMNPDNWRLHPSHQRDVLAEVLDRVGYVQQVIVNERTDRVVDGHLRIQLAADRGQPYVPFVVVDLTEDEERMVLATLDPLSAMAQADASRLSSLLEQLPDMGSGPLGGMLDDLRHIELPDYTGFKHGDGGGGGAKPAEPQDFWPTIRVQVPPRVYQRWQALMDAAEGDNDGEKFGNCLRDDA